MSTLASELRNKLERVVVEARDVAEAGARAALEAMAVHHHEPYPHMEPAQRALRNHLRARARQLGDRQDTSGRLAIDHLAGECAYEHWHRMLFARFLAENNLLIEPQENMAISLAEAEELAKEEGVDVWVFASRCAQRMLPQIFRPDDPLLQISFASEHQLRLERLLASLPTAVFAASDALGWVYQFWQTKKKKDVNDSEVKIGADEISAVTQLFTEPYMVEFLLHNTLGAWWAGKRLTAEDAHNAETEEALRKEVALPGVGWEYLRFVRGADGEAGPWRPAAGTFDGWPKTASELKVLDPCCGSGHFLVAALHHLVPIRVAEERLSVAEAVDAVLRDNLHGLEIDERCCQIAAFALAFEAWKMTGYRELPGLHIACTGIGPQSTEEQWLKLAEQSGIPLPSFGGEAIKNGLLNLHRLFSQAPTLGSLIDPAELPGDLIAADYETIQPYLTAILKAENADDETHERAVAAAGMVKAADLLAGEYTLVITNVPYLGKGSHDEHLMKYAASLDPDATSDLAYTMLVRIDRMVCQNSTCGLVIPQAWMFLNSYLKLRQKYLNRRQFNLVARLGPGAFETISGEVVQCALTVISDTKPDVVGPFAILDAAAKPGEPELTVAEKGRVLLGVHDGGDRQVRLTTPRAILDSPSSKFSFSEVASDGWLSDFADSYVGLQTGDSPRWIQRFWEQRSIFPVWMLFQLAPSRTTVVDGCTAALRWDMQDELRAAPGSRVQGLQALGRLGVLIQRMADLKACVYPGYGFDTNTAVLIPKTPSFGIQLLRVCSDESYATIVRDRAPGLSITNRALVEIPFEHPSKEDQYASIADLDQLLQTDDPTQWLFHGRPEESTAPLQAAVTRLLGYRWPAELDKDMRLSKRARELVKKCGELLQFADDDGIVCIPSVRGEEPASERLLALLAACGLEPGKIRELAGGADLDDWLRNSFFEEHCKLFHYRPFVWHLWDGRKRDGFHALINYHKLCEGGGKGRKLLESLTYSYLGEWITRQKDGVKRGEGGAEDRLAAAMELQKRLEAILAGEPPFDLFVRWKPLAEQPIGWEPDINDGVRLNIRPFLASDLPNGRTGAGILRYKPNIKWKKDRGKEPQRPKAEYPWFWGWDEKTEDFTGSKTFDGNRWNDCHYTNKAKQVAREAAEKRG